MHFEIVLLLLGFVFLIKGADLLVDGASSIAKKIGVSDIVIGLTVVSFGTSAPELVVNMLSAVSGHTDLALGNIIGSNIANTLLILGVAAIIYPLRIKQGTVWKEIPLALLASFALLFLANDQLIDGRGASAVTRIDGLILLLLFSIFLYYTFMTSRADIENNKADSGNPVRPPWLSGALIATGIVGLTLGGRWIVNSATSIATSFNISQSVIGLTVIAIGTSLPELATSAVAAWKKNVSIAVGNVVGSNLFNILFVLATTAVITPLPLSKELNLDLVVMIAAALLLFTAVFTGKTKRQIDRAEGIVFVLIYLAYIAYLVIRR